MSEILGVERPRARAVWRLAASELAVAAERAGWPARVTRALGELEGLGTLLEVVGASRGLDAAGDRFDPLSAYALTRVTLELALSPEVAWRRSGVTVLVAKSGDLTSAVPTDALFEHASELRHVVAGLVTAGDVVGARRLEQAVSLSPELGSLTVLSASRLSELAAAQIPYVLSNRRGELYLADLKPVPALVAVGPTLPSREVTVEELQRRVRARFPGALPLPSREALDDAVRVATGRVWGTRGYRPAQ
ncbi:hypothetical protein [Actinotalea fermentans]|uniref:hypothetical protein n=1 Tax=Actinotalea fermentans TaxID=43671 RepID=UPI0011BFB18D|nr:hypothetical protein [Actinotalea fermentans]